MKEKRFLLYVFASDCVFYLILKLFKEALGEIYPTPVLEMAGTHGLALAPSHSVRDPGRMQSPNARFPFSVWEDNSLAKKNVGTGKTAKALLPYCHVSEAREATTIRRLSYCCPEA